MGILYGHGDRYSSERRRGVFIPSAYKQLDLRDPVLFIGLLAVFGGVLTAFPFPMEKTDRVSGWNQYLFALPVTAKDYALSKIWLILSQSVLYLGCVLLYTAYAWFHLDVLILIYMLNIMRINRIYQDFLKKRSVPVCMTGTEFRKRITYL